MANGRMSCAWAGAAILATAATPSPAPGQAEVAAAGRYEAVARALDVAIAREVRAKEIPALSIALVDGEAIVWAMGFGRADPGSNVPATAETVYRVGSVSKLFADIALMQLVEQEKLDLDAPARLAVPEFNVVPPSGRDITLRHLMSHRAGIVREPPLGSYFDPTGPTLEATVASLASTMSVYEPEARIKYSNAGIAVVGRAVERLAGVPFADAVRRSVIAPLGLTRTDFEPPTEMARARAKGLMWTLDGRTFPAPTFKLGTSSAGDLESTAIDLGKFLIALFADGQEPGGPILKPEGTGHGGRRRGGGLRTPADPRGGRGHLPGQANSADR